MTKTKKMTKRDYFNKLKGIEAIAADAELTAFIDHELDLLDRKNSSDRKLSGNAAENVGLRAVVMDIMTAEPERVFTATEIWKLMPNWEKFSNQRVSALLRQLIDEGKVVRVADKKKSLFKLA